MDLKRIARLLRDEMMLRRLLLISLGVLLLSIFLWWSAVYTNSERVFRDMLRNNFMTNGYTRTIEAKNEGTSQQRIVQLQMGSKPSAHIIEKVVQNDSEQTTEFISTRDQTFARFLKYQNPDVENTWTILPQANALSSEIVERTYFPMGRLSQSERQDILQFIRTNNVYNVNFDTARSETVNGRDVFTYEVTIQLQSYAGMLQQFGKAVGFGSFVETINPADFASSQPVSLLVSVDKASHMLVQWQAVGADATESYSGYGIVAKSIELPKDYISLQQLESKL